ncbi:MAG: T9SS type A sorting domain-containing protein [Bacteroidia bacterium]
MDAAFAQPEAWTWAMRQTRLATELPSGKASTVSIDYPEVCIGFDWNASASRWDSVDRTEFSYVNTGGLQEKLGWLYNGNSFILNSRETHHYNAAGYDSLTLAEEWSGSAWEPDYKFDRTFDAYGNVTQSIGSTWNGLAWDTSSGYRATFTYHPNTAVASVIQESYAVGSGWNPDYQQTWSLDGLGRWDTVTGYLPDQSGWIPDKRLLDMHWRDFELKQPDSARFESFDTGSWEDFQRFRVTYGQFDSQEWIYEKPGLGWQPTDRFIFNYDSHGYEVLNEAYAWNAGWNLFDGIITHLTYDSIGQRTEVWTEVLSSGNYENDRRQVYLDFFTARPEPAAAGFQGLVLFPNPLDNLHQDLQLLPSSHSSGPALLELIDMQGRLVFQSPIQLLGNNSTSVKLPDHLLRGAYFCRIRTAKGDTAGQLLLVR